MNAIDEMRWGDGPPAVDELGCPIDQIHAFRAGTYEEVRAVLAYAAENNLLVNPVGGATSSGAFVSPSPEFMRRHGKNGIALLGFDPKLSNGRVGPFGEITLDPEARRLTVGASVTLRQIDEFLEEYYPHLRNPLRITTMDAHAVATALGSGGVSDGGDSSANLMRGARFIDGNGVVIDESYCPQPGDYFSHEVSGFVKVQDGSFGRQMTGRGGPYGIGLSVSIDLFKAPRDTHSIIWNFNGSNAREDLAAFIVRMNKWNNQMKFEGGRFHLSALELMDANAISVAKESSSWHLPLNGGDPNLVVIAEFVDFSDQGQALLSPGNLMMELCDDPCVISEKEFPNVAAVQRSDAENLKNFRLCGPDRMRGIFKAMKRDNPDIATDSTDWAVDPCDESLVNWYFDKFFALYDGIQSSVKRQALYGHGFERLDFHHRVIASDADLRRHKERMMALGLEIGRRQIEGKRVRLRGEKPLGLGPNSPDRLCVEKFLPADVRAHNAAALRRMDQYGTFVHKAFERW